jgi:hypothetical protein
MSMLRVSPRQHGLLLVMHTAHQGLDRLWRAHPVCPAAIPGTEDPSWPWRSQPMGQAVTLLTGVLLCT